MKLNCYLLRSFLLLISISAVQTVSVAQVPEIIDGLVRYYNNTYANPRFIFKGDTINKQTPFVFLDNLGGDDEKQNLSSNSNLFNSDVLVRNDGSLFGLIVYQADRSNNIQNDFVYQFRTGKYVYTYNVYSVCYMIEEVFSPLTVETLVDIPLLKNVVDFDQAVYAGRSRKTRNIDFSSFSNGNGFIKYRFGDLFKIDYYQNGKLHGLSEEYIQFKNKRRMIRYENFDQGELLLEISYSSFKLNEIKVLPTSNNETNIVVKFKKGKLVSLSLEGDNSKFYSKKELDKLKIKISDYDLTRKTVQDFMDSELNQKRGLGVDLTAFN